MRLRNLFIISIGVVVAMSNCSNMKDDKDDSSIESDTLVHSFPVNYLESLDKLDASQKMEGGSYVEMLELFEELNYTPEAWAAGIREIPRVYLVAIGDRWGSSTSKEITTLNKKQLFFRGLAPLVLKANELILKDRNRLEKIKSALEKNTSIPEMDQIWIMKLSELYKVKTVEDKSMASLVDELWQKVDIIPVSLALGQSAVESGWGTSRFAAAGNAMYGQWAWGEKAMTPKEQRKGLGNYGVAAFKSLQESVCAYMLNLNTHNAYADLRSKRAELRKNGKKITGPVLAETLIRYSERGESYVKEIKSMMEYNRLIPADDAYLSDNAPIYLIPAAN
jgi:uncharacterized FlgJ-related protein